MYKACRKSTSTLNLRRIKPWWSFKEEDNFYPSMRKWWSFLFKDFFFDRAFLLISHCVWTFFKCIFPFSLRTVDSLTTWAWQVLSSSGEIHTCLQCIPGGICPLAGLLFSMSHHQAKKILATEKTHFLSFATESQLLTSSWSAMPQYSWFIPILCFKFLLAQ